MSNVIGIDLGTSNSAAAVMKDGKCMVIPAVDGTTGWWWESVSFCCCFY